jgi:hypothetical protein
MKKSGNPALLDTSIMVFTLRLSECFKTTFKSFSKGPEILINSTRIFDEFP